MPYKMSKHSKIFAGLFSIAFFGSLGAMFIAWQIRYPASDFSSADGQQTIAYPPKSGTKPYQEPKIAVDTSQWKEYRNAAYGLSFMHAPTWKIRSIKNKEGYYIIEIDPGTKFDNFRVYVSKDDYFGLSGVPTQKTQVAGREALNLEGEVLGVKDNATYFTFDMGSSLSLKPYFQAMIETVKFDEPTVK